MQSLGALFGLFVLLVKIGLRIAASYKMCWRAVRGARAMVEILLALAALNPGHNPFNAQYTISYFVS